MKNLKRIIGIALLAAALGQNSSAQNFSPKLDSLLDRTLDSMNNLLKAKGLGAAMMFPDGSVWAGGTGVSSEVPLEKISPEHIFAIGSVNKTLTAATVLRLVDEGILRLDDSLHRWLDPLPHVNPNITLRQLLRHQTGVYDVITAPTYQDVMWADPDSIWALADVIKTFIKIPNFAPGTAFQYSNTNYLLLGMVIEKAAGQPHFEECREQFLSPLGLNSMAMFPFDPVKSPVAHLWTDLDGNGSPDDAHSIFSVWDSWHSSASPAGSYYATPSDMARWMRVYMSGSLLPADLMAAVKTTVSTPFPSGTRYGLGIMERNILSRKAWGHGGDAGYSASVWYFPDKDVSVAVLNNDGRRNSWSLVPTVGALLKTCLDFMASSGTSAATSAAGWEVFPNPFFEKLVVNAALKDPATDVELRLSDVFGKNIARRALENLPAGEQQIEFSELASHPPGLYFLTIFEKGKAAATLKVMKV